MLTNIFSNSKPFNYILVTGLTVLLFFWSSIGHPERFSSVAAVFRTLGLLLLIVTSLYIANFVTKRNGMSKDSTFPFYFYFAFLIFFPSFFSNTDAVIANFFIVLAMRRLISLQSLVSPKEKIFDASLWIFLATLFQFWAILYLVIVFASIIFHVSRDYRNWVIPFIAFFAVGSIFFLAYIFFDHHIVEGFRQRAQMDLSFDYFTNKMQNLSLAIFAALSFLLFFGLLFSLGRKPLMLHSAYKKILFAFLAGVAIFVLSPDKDNSLLAFTFMPLAVMATSYIENLDNQWAKEGFALGVTIFAIFAFVTQL